MLSLFSFNHHRSDINIMNRIQFFVLTGLSSLLVLLLAGHIALIVAVNHAQLTWSGAQVEVNKGNVAQNGLKQVAVRIFNDSRSTNDPGLKDLLAKEQITYTPTGTNAPETPAAPTK